MFYRMRVLFLGFNAPYGKPLVHIFIGVLLSSYYIDVLFMFLNVSTGWPKKLNHYQMIKKSS